MTTEQREVGSVNGFTDKMLAYLYDVEWQIVRVNMLGTWNKMATARKNYAALRSYYEKAVGGQEEKRRLWRIVNYLNAVRMGYSGQLMYGSDVDKLLVVERKFFQEEYAAVDNVAIGKWDWDKVKTDLRYLVALDLKMFNAIYNNLDLRRKTTIKRRGDLDHRNELVIMLGLMEATSLWFEAQEK